MINDWKILFINEGYLISYGITGLVYFVCLPRPTTFSFFFCHDLKWLTVIKTSAFPTLLKLTSYNYMPVKSNWQRTEMPHWLFPCHAKLLNGRSLSISVTQAYLNYPICSAVSLISTMRTRDKEEIGSNHGKNNNNLYFILFIVLRWVKLCCTHHWHCRQAFNWLM